MGTVEVQRNARLTLRVGSARNLGDPPNPLCGFMGMLLGVLFLTILLAGCSGGSSAATDPFTEGSAIEGIWIGRASEADLAVLWEGSLPAPAQSTEGVVKALSQAEVIAEGQEAGSRFAGMQIPNALLCALELADGRLVLLWFGRDLEAGEALIQEITADRNSDDTELTAVRSSTLLVEVAALAGRDSEDILPELSEDYGSETWGLWAGVVETIPAQPASLPASFHEAPTTSTRPYTDAYMDINEIEEPLWVFADEVHLADYVDEIEQALSKGRPVVIAQASPQEVQALLPSAPPLGESDTVPADDWVVFYSPWRGAWGSMSGVSGNLFHAMAEVTLQK